VRFDVIEVYLNEENFKIEHLKSVEILWDFEKIYFKIVNFMVYYK
jgi:hypothetical protein